MRLLTFLILSVMFTTRIHAQEDDLIYINAVAWSHDGSKIAAVGIRQPASQGYLRVINIETEAVLYSLDTQAGGFTSVAWSPDDRFIAAGSYEQVVWVFDIDEQAHLVSFWGHNDTVTAVDWHPNGTRLVSSGNWVGRNILWDMTIFKQIGSIHAGDLYDIAFSPDGERIAVGSSSGLYLFPMTLRIGQNRISEYRFAERPIASIAWNGSRIAFSTLVFPNITNPNNKVYSQIGIVDTTSGEMFSMIQTHNETIYGLAWSPDDRLIAAHSIDGFVNIWGVDTGTLLESFPGMTRYPSDISFSPYGGRLAYGQAIPGDNDVILGGAVQIVVPAPSLERLLSIAELCDVPSRLLPASEAAEELTTFVAAIHMHTIPAACAADLLAVSAWLRSDVP